VSFLGGHHHHPHHRRSVRDAAGITNFSGWRGAVDEARKGFRRNQRSMVKRFHRPVFCHKLRQWAADDPALMSAMNRLGRRYFRHNWNPPRWPYINPLQDASADLLRMRNALASPRRIHAEHGDNYYDVLDEIVADNVAAIRIAKKNAVALNLEFQDSQPVHWREVISLPTPDGFNLQVPAVAAGDEATPAKKA